MHRYEDPADHGSRLQAVHEVDQRLRLELARVVRLALPVALVGVRLGAGGLGLKWFTIVRNSCSAVPGQAYGAGPTLRKG